MREPVSAVPAVPVSNTYFSSLTGLRAVAASMVFFDHFNPFKVSLFGKFLHGFVSEWHVGVTIFFVLSGFLICYRYRDIVTFRNYWLWNYFVNRFGRIYPMYFIVTVFAFLPFVCHCSFADNRMVFLLNITFLRGLFDEYKFTGAATGWSLTVEEMFYFLFPLIILASRKIKLIFQPLLWIAGGLLLWVIFRNLAFHGFFATLKFLFEFTFFCRCVEFYTGILLALYVKQHWDGLSRKGYYRTAGGILWIVFGISLLVINRQHSKDPGVFLFYETIVNNFLLPPGIALLFYGLLKEKNFVRKMLESRVFVLFGKSSYVFYLIHNGPLFALLYFNLYQKLEIVYVLMQLIALLLFLVVEKPLNNFIRRKFQYTPKPVLANP
jgi:peptidoglycan/LPS O-acetylase OafA/YrhL